MYLLPIFSYLPNLSLEWIFLAPSRIFLVARRPCRNSVVAGKERILLVLVWSPTRQQYYALEVFTAAGVVQFGGRKTSPRTSTIVQFIFYFSPLRSARIFWEVRNKRIGLESYSIQVFIYLDPILIFISLWIDCLFEIRKIAVCFLRLSLPGHYRVIDEDLLAETT